MGLRDWGKFGQSAATSDTPAGPVAHWLHGDGVTGCQQRAQEFLLRWRPWHYVSERPDGRNSSLVEGAGEV